MPEKMFHHPGNFAGLLDFIDRIHASKRLQGCRDRIHAFSCNIFGEISEARFIASFPGWYLVTFNQP